MNHPVAPLADTRRRAPRATLGARVRLLMLPGLTLLFAVLWYVAIRTAEARRIAAERAHPVELARRTFRSRQSAEHERLKNLASLVAYDARLSSMLKVQPDPPLVEELLKGMASRMGDTDIAVLSVDGHFVAASRELAGRGEATDASGRASGDRATGGARSLRELEYWVEPGNPPRVLQVSTSPIHLGEPLGFVAVYAPVSTALSEVFATTGVASALAVGDEMAAAAPDELSAHFESLLDLEPGDRARVPDGDREWTIVVDDLRSAERPVRLIWSVEVAVERGADRAFAILLWVPIWGAVLFGALQALAWDRRRASL